MALPGAPSLDFLIGKVCNPAPSINPTVVVTLGACARGCNRGGYTLLNESWSLLLWCRNAMIKSQSPALGFNR